MQVPPYSHAAAPATPHDRLDQQIPLLSPEFSVELYGEATAPLFGSVFWHHQYKNKIEVNGFTRPSNQFSLFKCGVLDQNKQQCGPEFILMFSSIQQGGLQQVDLGVETL